MDIPIIDKEFDDFLGKVFLARESLMQKYIYYRKLLSQERNSKCLCGSEKKSKKCCLNNENVLKYNEIVKKLQQIRKDLNCYER